MASSYKMWWLSVGTIVIVVASSVVAQAPTKSKPLTRKEREKLNAEWFENLSHAQKRWLIYVRDHRKISDVTMQLGSMGTMPGGKVVSVGSPKEAVVILHAELDPRPLVWISGIDTSALTDDAYFNHTGIFWVPRTRTYQAVEGLKTVFEVELIPDAQKLLKEITPPKNAKLEDYPPK